MMSAKFPQGKLGEDFVSAIGLGCMGMAVLLSTTTSTSDEDYLKVLTAAADMGINFWVTSDSYGPFTNERLLGRWFKETGRRDEIFLSTKFGVKPNMAKMTMEVDGTPEYVKQACEASLERLGTDRIDLFY
jgi:aryl-alcohol dehydrogenase-like predicted oxidoreductase